MLPEGSPLLIYFNLTQYCIFYFIIVAALGLSYGVQDPLLCHKASIAPRHVGSQGSNPCPSH